MAVRRRQMKVRFAIQTQPIDQGFDSAGSSLNPSPRTSWLLQQSGEHYLGQQASPGCWSEGTPSPSQSPLIHVAQIRGVADLPLPSPASSLLNLEQTFDKRKPSNMIWDPSPPHTPSHAPLNRIRGTPDGALQALESALLSTTSSPSSSTTASLSDADELASKPPHSGYCCSQGELTSTHRSHILLLQRRFHLNQLPYYLGIRSKSTVSQALLSPRIGEGTFVIHFDSTAPLSLMLSICAPNCSVEHLRLVINRNEFYLEQLPVFVFKSIEQLVRWFRQYPIELPRKKPLMLRGFLPVGAPAFSLHTAV
eukprot:m.24232 g.24232  ORF g.24232 m.24232 type:complete len:309 (+) comp8568_c0_seq1:453-1379(+)